MSFDHAADVEVPVLVVGGGGAGLTASMLLATYGIEHLLVSARPETSDLPKAHVLNQRAMEVLDDVGVADTIEERGTPAHHMAATAYYAGFSRTRAGSRTAAGQAGVLGRGRDGRVLAPGQPVPADEPSPDPTRAAAQGQGRGSCRRGGSASATSCSTWNRTTKASGRWCGTSPPARRTWWPASTCSAPMGDGSSHGSWASSTRAWAW